jgi:hypothetical protein
MKLSTKVALSTVGISGEAEANISSTLRLFNAPERQRRQSSIGKNKKNIAPSTVVSKSSIGPHGPGKVTSIAASIT